VSTIGNISEGTRFYRDVAGLLEWTGSEYWYGIREYNLIPVGLDITSYEYINSTDIQGGNTGSSTTTPFIYNNVVGTYTGANTGIGQIGQGSGAEWKITTVEGEITQITASDVGSGYTIGDTISFSSNDLGGSPMNTFPILAPPRGNGNILMEYIGLAQDTYYTGSFGPITASNVTVSSGTTDIPTFQLTFRNSTLTTTSPVPGILFSIAAVDGGEGIKEGDTFDFYSSEINEFISASLVSDGIINPGDPLPTTGTQSPLLTIIPQNLDISTSTLTLSEPLFITEVEDTQNQFSVKINDTGLVTQKFACKFPQAFRAKYRPSGTFAYTRYIYLNYDSNYDTIINNKVIVPTSGFPMACWEIIETLFSKNDAYFYHDITSGCTLAPITTFPISIKFNTNSSVVCTSNDNTYYFDDESFLTATKIYKTPVSNPTNYADSGWYSNGGIRREWNKSTGTLGLPTMCGGITINYGGGIGGGTSKIICNELYKQGYLPENIWEADERYGDMMFIKDPKMIIGYQMWARKVVKYMRAKPQHTKYLYRILKPWTEYMGYEMGAIDKQNYIGKTFHTIAKYYSYLVFDLGGGKRLLNLYNYKKFRKNIG